MVDRNVDCSVVQNSRKLRGEGGVDALLCRASLVLRERKTGTNPSFRDVINALTSEFGHSNLQMCQRKLRELLHAAKASAAQERKFMETGSTQKRRRFA